MKGRNYVSRREKMLQTVEKHRVYISSLRALFDDGTLESGNRSGKERLA